MTPSPSTGQDELVGLARRRDDQMCDELADRIETLTAELAALKHDFDRLADRENHYVNECARLEERVRELEAGRKQIDRLVKFAEMMLGQVKSARMSAQAVYEIEVATGTELIHRQVEIDQFDRTIKIGELAIAPFRCELSAINGEQR